jgi:ABC-2 type transport system permease protein
VRVAIVRNELRLLRHDPVPAVILLAMPVVLMSLLAPALSLALIYEGYPAPSGAEQTVPGMACVFSFFVVAMVAFALFREHGWHTWARLRAAGVGSGAVVVGKLTVPAATLAVQHVVLFAFGVVFLDLEVSGSWLAVALVSVSLGAMVLAMGLAAAAVFDTIQQVNAVTNLGAMVFGALGGGFVPVSTLPAWIEPLAPLSPAYWAMEGYTGAVLDGGGVADVLGPCAVLAALAVACLAVARWRLRLDAPKRTWG